MNYLKQLFANKFILSSGIVLVGSTLANAINYLYNLVLGRILTPAEYGEVAAYVTLAMIVVVPSGTLAILVTKYVSEYTALNQPEKVRAVYRSSVKWALIIGTLMLAIFLALSPFISSYLKTSLWPTMVFALILPVSLIASSSRGALQGLHEFSTLTIMGVLESACKLLFAVGFVYMGWGVGGAVGGLLAGSVLGYLYSILKLRKKVSHNVISDSDLQVDYIPKSLLKSIPNYVYIAFFSSLFLAIFGNIDVVLAKHYLPEHDAGQYAALAVLGRIVTYSSIAIITVLLPMAAAAKASNDYKKSRKLLFSSLGITLGVSLIILLFFIFIPELTIKILFGSDYLEMAKYLALFGTVMLLGSLSKIFINYFLATHEKYFIIPFGIISLSEVISILYFHNSIQQIISILLIFNILLFVSMNVMYFISHRNIVIDEPPISNLNDA